MVAFDLFYPFEFTAPLTRLLKMVYDGVVVVPPGIATALSNLGGRPRLTGELAGRAFAGAAQPLGGGSYYLIVNKRTRAATGLDLGDPVSVRLRPDDPDRVDVPPALATALAEADPELRAIWEGLTPGTRRGFAHRVASAKRPETVQKRVVEVLLALEDPDPSPYPKRR